MTGRPQGGRDRGGGHRDRDREREREREREQRERERHSSGRQPGPPPPVFSQDMDMAPPPPPTSNAGRVNEYFVPRDGIDREVITADICRYLGNDALVRPGTYEQADGRQIQGYYINAYRNLTSAMIQDLKADSARWEQERRSQARNVPGMGPGAQSVGASGYRYSETHHQRQQFGPTGAEASYGGSAMDVDYQSAPPASGPRYPGTGSLGYSGAAGGNTYTSQPQQTQTYQPQQPRFPPSSSGYGAQAPQYGDEPGHGYPEPAGFGQTAFGRPPGLSQASGMNPSQASGMNPSQAFGMNHPTAVTQAGVTYVGGSNQPLSGGLTSGPHIDSDYRSHYQQGLPSTAAPIGGGYGQSTARQPAPPGGYMLSTADPDRNYYGSTSMSQPIDVAYGRGPGAAGMAQPAGYGAVPPDTDYDANPRASSGLSSAQTSSSTTLVGSTNGQSSGTRRDAGRDREHDRDRDRERDRRERERTGEDREDRHARERGERRHRTRQ